MAQNQQLSSFGQYLTVNVTSNTITFSSNNIAITANGSTGSNGQVLTSNGTTSYWANGSSGGVTTGKAIAMAMIFGG